MDQAEYLAQGYIVHNPPNTYAEGGGYQRVHHYVPSSQSPYLNDDCPQQHQHLHHQQGFSSHNSHQQQQFVPQQFEAADYSGEEEHGRSLLS